MDPRSIVLVGKPAYYWSYMAPVAREFRRRFGEPAAVASLHGLLADEPRFIRPETMHPLRRHRVAIAFDVWSMIAAWACARTVVYVHHSLVGKGLVFRGEEPFRPFFFADRLCLPLPDRQTDVSPGNQCKVRVTGHLPFDWLHVEPPLARWQDTLQAWGEGGRRLRVGVLCTHGEFGSVHLLEDIARLRPQDAEFGVKLHGYLKGRALPPGMRSLGDCPTALAVQACDLVITDHSTAAVEAHALGVPCICFRSEALKRLQAMYPGLSELHYLDEVHCYETLPELAALLEKLARWPSPQPAERELGSWAHRASAATLLDLCIKETI
jgi:hypothetical protein